MLWCNVPILIGSLLYATCKCCYQYPVLIYFFLKHCMKSFSGNKVVVVKFKFARASCQVPVFDIPVLKVIIPPLFQRSRK